MAIQLCGFQLLEISEAATINYYNEERLWNPSFNYVAVKKNPVIQYKVTKEEITPCPQGVKSTPSIPSTTRADQILQTGAKYIGTPYKARISGHTLDCSGFIRFIFAQHGVTLPGGSYNQVNVGKTVSKSELKKGDLVFFRVGNSSRIGHVAVYMGNNKVLHTYDPGVKYDSLDAPWLEYGYVTAKRIL